MSVAGVARWTTSTLVIIDVFFGLVALGLALAVTLVSVGTSLTLGILDVLGDGARGRLAITREATRARFTLSTVDVFGHIACGRMSVTGVASWTINTLIVIHVLFGLVTCGLCVVVTLVSVGTSLTLSIVDVFGHSTRGRLAITREATRTHLTLFIVNVFGHGACGRLPITIVASGARLALSIVDVFGHFTAPRVSIVSPVRGTVRACSTALRVFTCALVVASAVFCLALVHI